MSENTVITVRGSYTGRFAPEHAVVTGMISLEGAEREPVFVRASGIAEVLKRSLGRLLDSEQGPVVRWSAQNLRIWSQRPWNNQGKQLAPVFHAQLDFSATFTDTEALGHWVEEQATIDGIVLHGVRWSLSDERLRAARAEVRALAVSDAIDRARAYGASLGLSTLEPIAIADPGMLGDPSAAPQDRAFETMSVRAASADASSGVEFSFTPEELEITASVDARFLAR